MATGYLGQFSVAEGMREGAQVILPVEAGTSLW